MRFRRGSSKDSLSFWATLFSAPSPSSVSWGPCFTQHFAAAILKQGGRVLLKAGGQPALWLSAVGVGSLCSPAGWKATRRERRLVKRPGELRTLPNGTVWCQIMMLLSVGLKCAFISSVCAQMMAQPIVTSPIAVPELAASVNSVKHID